MGDAPGAAGTIRIDDPAERAATAISAVCELLGNGNGNGNGNEEPDCVGAGPKAPNGEPGDNDDVLELLENLALASQALDALEVRALVRAEESGVSVRRRGHRLRRWWANQTGVCRAEASERIRIAVRLTVWFPQVADALDRGEISFAHAARLIKATTPDLLDALSGLQPDLVRLARQGNFEQFERDLLIIVDRLNPDGPVPDQSRLNQVRVTNEFGNTRITGLLDPIRGEIVANALKSGVDAIRREREAATGAATDAADSTAESSASAGPAATPVRTMTRGPVTDAGATPAVEHRQAVSSGDSDATESGAHTDVGTLTEGGPGDRSTGPDRHATSEPPAKAEPSAEAEPPAEAQPSAEAKPSAQAAPQDLAMFSLPAEHGDRIGALQADALVRICQTALSASNLAGPLPSAHIDVITYADDPTIAVTRNGLTLLPDDVRDAIGCNAIYRPIVLDGAGVPLRMGRARRLATPDQRRAVFARDGGCVFPGCGVAPRDCDVHHVEHWRDGGPTDVGNLACLCRFHHGVTHSTGWDMSIHSATPEQPHHFEWSTPTGAVVPSVHRQPGTAARLAQQPSHPVKKLPGKLSQNPATERESGARMGPKRTRKLDSEPNPEPQAEPGADSLPPNTERDESA